VTKKHTQATAEPAVFTTVSAGAGDVGKGLLLDAAGHVDASAINDADIDHGSIGGLGDDDHSIYILVDGSRAFSGPVTINHGAVNVGLSLVSTDAGSYLNFADNSTVNAPVMGAVADDFLLTVGAVTQLRFEGNGAGLDIPNSDVVLDEDDMASDDAKRLATQQSIKKYVDDEIAGLTTDHGELVGLGDDDHSQYLNTSRHTATNHAGLDTTAIHDNTPAEINALALKGAPVAADVIIIEDSADSWNKKKAAISTIGGGAASSVTFDDSAFDKFLDSLDDTTDFLQDILDLIDEQAVEVVESTTAPATTYPGLLWVDTDAANTVGEPLVVMAYAATSTLTNGVATKLLWTEEVDTNGVFASSTFTAPSDGIYSVNASCLIGPATEFSGGEYFDLIIYVNGTPARYNRVTPDNTTSHYVQNDISSFLSLSAGDTVDIYGWQNSGAGQPVYTSSGYFGRLDIHFIRSM
jgi:hypothetical protein